MQQTLLIYGRNAIFDILCDYEWHSTTELSRAAKQYNARIYELRRKGLNIVSMRNEGKFGFHIQNTKRGDI
jgi:hypothetical protein